MSNETDLDWLARNVHKWKLPFAIQSSTMLNVVLHEYHANVFNPATGAACQITKSQWFARRAELQKKPSWKEAPEWATHLVQITTGSWIWIDDGRLEIKLESVDKLEYSGSYGMVLGGWRDTLERRPESTRAEMEVELVKAAFKPFTSIEDNQEQKMKQDNEWFERGELPPVGAACQFFSGGYDSDWFDWCIFHGLASCGGFIVEHHHRTSPERVIVALFDPALTKFRPIRTEREVAIEEMQSDIAERWANCEELARHLVDKGWVKGGK